MNEFNYLNSIAKSIQDNLTSVSKTKDSTYLWDQGKIITVKKDHTPLLGKCITWFRLAQAHWSNKNAIEFDSHVLAELENIKSQFKKIEKEIESQWILNANPGKLEQIVTEIKNFNEKMDEIEKTIQTSLSEIIGEKKSNQFLENISKLHQEESVFFARMTFLKEVAQKNQENNKNAQVTGDDEIVALGKYFVGKKEIIDLLEENKHRLGDSSQDLIEQAYDSTFETVITTLPQIFAENRNKIQEQKVDVTIDQNPELVQKYIQEFTQKVKIQENILTILNQCKEKEIFGKEEIFKEIKDNQNQLERFLQEVKNQGEFIQKKIEESKTNIQKQQNIIETNLKKINSLQDQQNQLNQNNEKSKVIDFLMTCAIPETLRSDSTGQKIHSFQETKDQSTLFRLFEDQEFVKTVNMQIANLPKAIEECKKIITETEESLEESTEDLATLTRETENQVQEKRVGIFVTRDGPIIVRSREGQKESIEKLKIHYQKSLQDLEKYTQIVIKHLSTQDPRASSISSETLTRDDISRLKKSDWESYPGSSPQTALKLLEQRDYWKRTLQERQHQLDFTTFGNEEKLMNRYQTVLKKLEELFNQFNLSVTFAEFSYDELNKEYLNWQKELGNLRKTSTNPERQKELGRRIQLMSIRKDEIFSLNKEKDLYRTYFSEKTALENLQRKNPENDFLEKKIAQEKQTLSKMSSLLKEKEEEFVFYKQVNTVLQLHKKQKQQIHDTTKEIKKLTEENLKRGQTKEFLEKRKEALESLISFEY